VKPLRVLEGALLAGGVVLLGFWGVMRVHRSVGEKADVARFAEAREAVRSAPASEAPAGDKRPPVDTSLWAPERVRAYEESLRKDFGAPLGVLSIPKIRLEVPVLDGTDDLTLNSPDLDLAARPQGHDVGPPAVWQADLQERRIAEIDEHPRRPAGNRQRRLRPADFGATPGLAATALEPACSAPVAPGSPWFAG
jgi:hypothetical protein